MSDKREERTAIGKGGQSAGSPQDQAAGKPEESLRVPALLREWLHPGPDDSVLEVSADAVEKAVSSGTSYLLPYEDESFEIVTCCMQAARCPDAQMLLSEIGRVLKPGGRLGFQDLTLPPEAPAAVLVGAFERSRDPRHVQAYNETGWKTLIKRAGMLVERAELVDERHELGGRASDESGGGAATAELKAQMAEGTEGMRRWLAPENDAHAVRSFRHRHLVVLARKPG